MKLAYFVIAGSVFLSGAAGGQPVEQPLPTVNVPDQGGAAYSQEQIRELVAPIALYPDALLTDVLAAATFPTQVVEAERFLTDPSNGGLQGAALISAAVPHRWESSVMALLAFPPVLRDMDANLEYTQQLGEAFANQPHDVLAAIQSLRRQAEAAGTLASGPQDTVSDNGGIIGIDSPDPDELYLPSYNADCSFGPVAGCDAGGYGVVWLNGIFVSGGYRHWGHIDWHGHAIRTGGPASSGQGQVWHHVPPTMSGGFHYAPPANAPFVQARGLPRPAPVPVAGARVSFPGHAAHFAPSPHVSLGGHAGGGRR